MENATQIKERLHGKIEGTDDVNLLQEIESRYFPNEDSLTEQEQSFIDNDMRSYLNEDEVMNIVQDREAKYFSGEDKGMSIEEFKEKFKKEHGI